MKKMLYIVFVSVIFKITLIWARFWPKNITVFARKTKVSLNKPYFLLSDT